ncbi:MAG: hypothetical protein V1702_02275, partial [Candidatus Woesearchaeota archaeon]
MKKAWLSLALVAILCIGSYANTFTNHFVWDENVFVKDNPEIRSLRNIPGFFSESEFGLYRPLRTALYAAVYSVWQLNPIGYHLNSLFWHILCSVMIYLIISRLSKRWILSISAALIFASTPVHIERVTNMTGGFDLLGIFLMLAAFYSYVLYSESRNKLFIGLSLVSFILALFSSEEALVLPLLVVLYEILFNSQGLKEKSRLAAIGSFFIVLAAFIILRVFALHIGARVEEYPAGSFGSTMLTMPKVFLYYLLLVFFPFK